MTSYLASPSPWSLTDNIIKSVHGPLYSTSTQNADNVNLGFGGSCDEFIAEPTTWTWTTTTSPPYNVITNGALDGNPYQTFQGAPCTSYSTTVATETQPDACCGSDEGYAGTFTLTLSGEMPYSTFLDGTFDDADGSTCLTALGALPFDTAGSSDNFTGFTYNDPSCNPSFGLGHGPTYDGSLIAGWTGPPADAMGSVFSAVIYSDSGLIMLKSQVQVNGPHYVLATYYWMSDGSFVFIDCSDGTASPGTTVTIPIPPYTPFDSSLYTGFTCDPDVQCFWGTFPIGIITKCVDNVDCAHFTP